MNQIKNIGIIGGGKMGTDIFYYFSQFNLKLCWVNRSQTEKALKKYHRKINRALHNELITNEKFNFRLKNHKITDNLTELQNCDLIIESITENIEKKQMLFSHLFDLLSDDCIVTTNSSSFLPSQLIENKKHLKRTVGLHFFYPVAMKKIVELIETPETPNILSKKLKSLLHDVNMPFLTQNYKNAFLLNRIMLHLQASAFNFVASGQSTYYQLDEVVKSNFGAIGIFEMMDYIGLDLILISAKNYMMFEQDKSHYTPLLQFLTKKIKQNETGIKTNHGFYNYKNVEKQKAINTNNQNIIKFLANSFANSYHCALKKNKISVSSFNYGLNQYLDSEIETWLKQATK